MGVPRGRSNRIIPEFFFFFQIASAKRKEKEQGKKEDNKTKRARVDVKKDTVGSTITATLNVSVCLQCRPLLRVRRNPRDAKQGQVPLVKISVRPLEYRNVFDSWDTLPSPITL